MNATLVDNRKTEGQRFASVSFISGLKHSNTATRPGLSVRRGSGGSTPKSRGGQLIYLSIFQDSDAEILILDARIRQRVVWMCCHFSVQFVFINDIEAGKDQG